MSGNTYPQRLNEKSRDDLMAKVLELETAIAADIKRKAAEELAKRDAARQPQGQATNGR